MKRVLSWVLDNLDFLATVLIAVTILLFVSAGQLMQDQLPNTTLGLLITLTLFLAIKNYRLGLKLQRLESTLSDVQ